MPATIQKTTARDFPLDMLADLQSGTLTEIFLVGRPLPVEPRLRVDKDKAKFRDLCAMANSLGPSARVASTPVETGEARFDRAAKRADAPDDADFGDQFHRAKGAEQADQRVTPIAVGQAGQEQETIGNAWRKQRRTQRCNNRRAMDHWRLWKGAEMTFVNPRLSANGHAAQNVKGAVRNGNGSHYAKTTVASAVTTAKTTIATQSASLGYYPTPGPSVRR